MLLVLKLVPFERFAPCSPIPYSFFWSNSLLLLKVSSRSRAACSCLCRAFCSVFCPLRAVCFFVSKFSSLFRAACSLFSISMISFEILWSVSIGFATLYLFSKSLLVFGRFAQFFSLFRMVCSLFSKSPVVFERLATCVLSFASPF